MPRHLGRFTCVFLLGTMFLPLVNTPPAGATFPGGNGLIAFSSDTDGDREIFVVPSGGGATVQLTHNTLEDEYPSFSPDGKHIYWDQELGSGKHVIMSMKPNGTGVQKLTPSTKDSWQPAPGPGNRIAFVREAGGNSEIFAMDANGSNVDQLTNTGRFEDEPEWSPNGKLIAFSRSYHFYSAIFTMNAQGRNKMSITPADADYYDPSFSPDSKRIAVDSDLTTTSDIYTMKADGSDLVQVTSDADRQILPKYSPDGTKIAYSTNTGAAYEIVTKPLAGGGTTQLTFDGDYAYAGSWQAT